VGWRNLSKTVAKSSSNPCAAGVLTSMPIWSKSSVPMSKSYKVPTKFLQSSHNYVYKEFSIVRCAVVSNINASKYSMCKQEMPQNIPRVSKIFASDWSEIIYLQRILLN
jgi:hypothetical protein